MGKVSNFALVIQLNIPKDKFRIIILSKLCIIGSFLRADPLVRHTLLKEFNQGHPTTIFGKYLFGRRFEI